MADELAGAPADETTPSTTAPDRPDLVHHLHRLGTVGATKVSTLEEARRQHEAGERVASAQPVLRGASLIPLDGANRLLTELAHRAGALPRARRAETDAWLAPRLHAALRLTRREASDPTTWQLLAAVHPVASGYARWRWADDEGAVTAIRLTGRMNQQALARLWWGAELFRDGADYRPVSQAFTRFELPNLCLHRPFVRNRAVALAVVERLASDDPLSSEQIGAFARTITLVLPTLSMASLTSDDRSNPGAYHDWLAEPPPTDFDDLPAGPDDGSPSEEARQRARSLVHHVLTIAGLA